MYADDTVMYFAVCNAQEISNTLTSELAKVNDWLVHNSLFIHQGKTECVLFGTGSRLANANLSVNIDGKELTRVAEYKYLGVILDESLSWNARVNHLISKVSKRLGILGRTRGSISMHIAGIIANEPAERRRAAGEAAENSAARRMVYAKKFSIGIEKCKCKV